MSYLNREQILAAKDVVTEDVEVPEWGGTVRVKGLTGTQRDQFEASIMEQRGKKRILNTHNIRAKLISWCVLDDKDKPMFGHPDVEALGLKSAAALERVYEVASRLSGLRDEDIEEMVEDFGEATSDGSASPSQSG